jgi:hypothetical protein
VGNTRRTRWGNPIPDLGLAPRVYQSGEFDLSGHISKCGDRFMRHALYEAANSRLRISKKWSSLRAWGLKRRLANANSGPISEQFAVALYESLALEGRKWMAELISACFPHAKNRVGICSSKTAHEQRMMAEVLLQFRQHPNTRAMLADFHQL